MITYRKIKNINGTSEADCNCDSWLDHWLKFSGQSRPFCCVEKDCINQDLLGAHVQRADTTDENWYILPLCSEHNKSKKTLEVIDAYNLVSANVKETCG